MALAQAVDHKAQEMVGATEEAETVVRVLEGKQGARRETVN